MKQAAINISISFREVYKKPPYIIFSVIIFFSVLAFAIWLPNFKFLSHTATSDFFTLSQKVGIISSLLGGIQTNFSPLSRAITIIVAFLFAINLSFLFFYLRRAAEISKSAGLGTSGFLLGMIGIGCASCGSVLITAIFGIGFTAGFLGFFPLRGQEFGIISIIILIFSIYLLAKKIKDPAICKVKPRKIYFK